MPPQPELNTSGVLLYVQPDSDRMTYQARPGGNKCLPQSHRLHPHTHHPLPVFLLLWLHRCSLACVLCSLSFSLVSLSFSLYSYICLLSLHLPSVHIIRAAGKLPWTWQQAAKISSCVQDCFYMLQGFVLILLTLYVDMSHLSRASKKNFST